MKAVHNYIIYLNSLHFVQHRPSSVYEAIVRLEGLGHLKNPMTSMGIEPITFRLVAFF
jgi:hypothetical protein